MLNDEAVLVAFLLGMAVGVGMALTVVGWKIRHMRSAPLSPPSNQPTESRLPEPTHSAPTGAALVSGIRRPFLRTVSGLKFKR